MDRSDVGHELLFLYSCYYCCILYMVSMMVGFTFIVWFWIIFNIGPVQDYCLLCYGDFTNTCGFCLNCRRACEKWKSNEQQRN
ncbi:hypothetical protein Y032_0031g2368 [Ancylostoma ceylanicum]|uniref:Uncharacterized protein n=1 Tax=Ancylostoma ceylanicum TaxID=53326 RepID=A0A016UR01_9BILA|nr:hypothetical protein Y032_0031g2368 [Ancylostoma ceylanicum]